MYCSLGTVTFSNLPLGSTFRLAWNQTKLHLDPIQPKNSRINLNSAKETRNRNRFIRVLIVLDVVPGYRVSLHADKLISETYQKKIAIAHIQPIRHQTGILFGVEPTEMHN